MSWFVVALITTTGTFIQYDNPMKISILNNQVIEWIDLSHKWAEVFDIDDSYLWKLQSKTHYFDIESKEVVAYPIPEPEPIPEPTEEEVKESKIQEIQVLLSRKWAFIELWEDTKDINKKIKDIKGA